MSIRESDWCHCDHPIDEARVDEVERILRVKFPSSFRACVLLCNGGMPRKNEFPVQGTFEFVGGIGALLSLSGDDENILTTMSWLDDRPAALIPFAQDGGGDFVAFDYGRLDARGSPAVVCWHRTGLPGNKFMFLADNFDEFLRMLRAPTEV